MPPAVVYGTDEFRPGLVAYLVYHSRVGIEIPVVGQMMVACPFAKGVARGGVGSVKHALFERTDGLELTRITEVTGYGDGPRVNIYVVVLDVAVVGVVDDTVGLVGEGVYLPVIAVEALDEEEVEAVGGHLVAGFRFFEGYLNLARYGVDRYNFVVSAFKRYAC